MQRTTSKIANENGLIKCNTCHAFKNIMDYIKTNKQGINIVLKNCITCRIKYVHLKHEQEMRDGKKKCNVCRNVYEMKDFTNKEGKILNNCITCRIEYIKKKEKENGMRNCYVCKLPQPLEEYYKKYEDKATEYSSCRDCRTKWYNEHKKTLCFDMNK